MIRILLVDDHTLFRQPLAFMLEREPDLKVVAQAGTYRGALSLLGNDIDVAIVDFWLPDGEATQLARQIRRQSPETAVLMLTTRTDRPTMARCVEAGAAGVLNKSAGVADIIDAVRHLAAGEFLLDPMEMLELVRLATAEREQRQLARERLARLTSRERDVLSCLADGLNDRQIAERLSISNDTVRTHMVNLLGKLEVDSRLSALVFAVRHHALEID